MALSQRATPEQQWRASTSLAARVQMRRANERVGSGLTHFMEDQFINVVNGAANSTIFEGIGIFSSTLANVAAMAVQLDENAATPQIFKGVVRANADFLSGVSEMLSVFDDSYYYYAAARKRDVNLQR